MFSLSVFSSAFRRSTLTPTRVFAEILSISLSPTATREITASIMASLPALISSSTKFATCSFTSSLYCRRRITFLARARRPAVTSGSTSSKASGDWSRSLM